MPHLAQTPCSTITLESRGQLGHSDLATVQMLRSGRAIESTLRVEHAVGRNEPTLWTVGRPAPTSRRTGPIRSVSVL